MSDQTTSLNPQPLPPVRLGPVDPTPWRGVATIVSMAASLEAVARRAGDERLAGLLSEVIDDLCPPMRRLPIPPPPPWLFLGIAVELLDMAAAMPESLVRAGVLARAQQIIGHAANPARIG